MMAKGDETAGGEPERDLLAQRRARRSEAHGEATQVPGEQILIRRAEAAEEQAHELEERLAGIQRRLQEAERECSAASERLTQREAELRRSSERLAGGERELGSVSSRLAKREEELRLLSGRLANREDDLRLLSGRLGRRDDDLRAVSERLREREQQLGRLEQEVVARVRALEQRVEEVGRELVGERDAREAAERELARLTAAHSAVEPLIGELKAIAHRLRLAAELSEQSRPAAGPQGEAGFAAQPGPGATETSQAGAPVAPQRPQAGAGFAAQPGPGATQAESAGGTEPSRWSGPAAPAGAGSPAQSPSERERRTQMTDALAAAVERLRARVAAVGELHAERGGQAAAGPGTAAEPPRGDAGSKVPPPAPVSYEPPPAAAIPATATATAGGAAVAAGGGERRPWLAGAIRRLAQSRDAKLAGELVLELLRAHGLSASGAAGYGVALEELGSFRLRAGADGATIVQAGEGEGAAGPPAFRLQGTVAAFAELAGGGVARAGIVRLPAGLRVRGGLRGGRRRARRLMGERRQPVVLAEMARAGAVVWPGLLLAALAEAVDPAWTASHSFTVEFAIEGAHNARLLVTAADGAPLRLSRVGGERPPAQAQAQVSATVHLDELTFLCLLSGEPLPSGRRVLLEGERSALERLLAWADRVQGIRRFGA